jgi:N-acetylmuramoyl-L-alanine amidase
MLFQGKARYPVTEIILHCADTRPEWMAGRPLTEKVAEIRRWHIEQRGWRDIGYHWVIDRDVAVAPGRPETEIGAHVEGHNAGTIGICLLGGYGAKADDLFEKNFTAGQKAAALKLIAQIKGRTAISKISGHNDCLGEYWRSMPKS